MHTSDMFEIPEFIATSLVKKLIQVLFIGYLKVSTNVLLTLKNYLPTIFFFTFLEFSCFL